MLESRLLTRHGMIFMGSLTLLSIRLIEIERFRITLIKTN